MYIQTEMGEGVVAYHAMNLTSYEMVQLNQMKKRVVDVLNSHHPKCKGKKIYLSDDDLAMIASIFKTLTCRYVEGKSSFDESLSALLKEQKEMFSEGNQTALDV